MKLSSVAYAACIALSATVADAQTTFTSITASTVAAEPATAQVTLVAGVTTAHAANTDYFKVILPETFDAVLTEAAVVAAELGMTCTTGTGAGDTITLATDYDGTYAASTRTLTLTSKAVSNKMCITGPLTLVFKKSTYRAKQVAATSVSITNSKVAAEITTPITGPSAVAPLVAALDGTSQPGAYSTVNDTFSIQYTAGAVVASGTVTLALHGYTFASDSACTVGGTACTTTVGTAVDGYAFVTFPSAFTAAEQTIACSKVTRGNVTTAKAGGIQLWTNAGGSAIKAGFKDTVVSTNSPTPQPTAAPPTAAPPAAAAGAACTVGASGACVANTTCTVTNATASNTTGTCKADATSPTAASPTTAATTPTAAKSDHSSALSLSSAPIILAALMVGLGSMNN